MIKGALSNPEGLHLSEENFRRFELIFERFLSVYPEPFRFKPEKLALTTTAARLRDAANALLTKDFSSIIDRDHFREAWRNVIVTIRADQIVIATRERQRDAARAIIQECANGPKMLTINNPSVEVLNALAVLFLQRALTDPVLLTGIVPSYYPPPGVVFEPNSDSTYTML